MWGGELKASGGDCPAICELSLPMPPPAVVGRACACCRPSSRPFSVHYNLGIDIHSSPLWARPTIPLHSLYTYTHTLLFIAASASLSLFLISLILKSPIIVLYLFLALNYPPYASSHSLLLLSSISFCNLQ